MRPTCAIFIDRLRAAREQFLPIRLRHSERYSCSFVNVASGSAIVVCSQVPEYGLDESVVGGYGHVAFSFKVIGLSDRTRKLTCRGRCKSLMWHETSLAAPVRCSAWFGNTSQMNRSIPAFDQDL